jgi:hypothetical protein
MILVAIMAELLEEYTTAVARAVERLLSSVAPRRILPRVFASSSSGASPLRPHHHHRWLLRHRHRRRPTPPSLPADLLSSAVLELYISSSTSLSSVLLDQRFHSLLAGWMWCGGYFLYYKAGWKRPLSWYPRRHIFLRPHDQYPMAHDYPFSLRLPVHASDHLEGSWLLPLSHLQIYASAPFAPAGSAKTYGLSRDHPTCSCPPPPPCRVPLRSSSHSLTRVPRDAVVNS